MFTEGQKRSLERLYLLLSSTEIRSNVKYNNKESVIRITSRVSFLLIYHVRVLRAKVVYKRNFEAGQHILLKLFNLSVTILYLKIATRAPRHNFL